MMARVKCAALLSILLCSCLASASGYYSRMLAEPGEVEIVLWPLSAKTTVGTSVISVASPSDPELTSYGGSGGPILELIATTDRGSEVKGTVQAIYVFAKPSADGVPELSVWSKTGVGSFVMCRYVPLGHKYCPTWCQDYEVDDPGPSKTGPRRDQTTCD